MKKPFVIEDRFCEIPIEYILSRGLCNLAQKNLEGFSCEDLLCQECILWDNHHGAYDEEISKWVADLIRIRKK